MKLSKLIQQLQETAEHIEDVEVVAHNSMKGIPCPLEIMYINNEGNLELDFSSDE